jgi:hypothetical protein
MNPPTSSTGADLVSWNEETAGLEFNGEPIDDASARALAGAVLRLLARKGDRVAELVIATLHQTVHLLRTMPSAPPGTEALLAAIVQDFGEPDAAAIARERTHFRRGLAFFREAEARGELAPKLRLVKKDEKP